jgi:ferrous iron transport protein B
VVLTGNPNCGKTTIFNLLTGLRAKVGNYAGVTVERKEGRLQGSPSSHPVAVLDLPGTYSLSPQSIDEQIARDVLFGRIEEVPPPALIVIVVDASNLERNLYYATQVIELGYPTLVALNMMDVARQNGEDCDVHLLAERLGVPVVPLVATRHDGDAELRREVLARVAPREPSPPPRLLIQIQPQILESVAALARQLQVHALHSVPNASAEALLLITDPNVWTTTADRYPGEIRDLVAEARTRCEKQGIDWRSTVIEARYALAGSIHEAVVSLDAVPDETVSDRIDQWVTHRVWGTGLFLVLMGLIFQSIFSFARLPMDALQAGIDWLGALVANALAPGDLNGLLVDGVIAGVGAVVVFLPQILLLFLFIGLLEDTGYMARAAFLMDRLMSKVGLHGKSFIPMLSSFACAIPGIMATRTIESPKDRLVTMLIAPLMSCSARLPVYTLLIAACIPEGKVLGIVRWDGLTLLSMYLLGVVAALAMGWVFKNTLLKGDQPLLIMELPPYKQPVLRVVLRHMWDRSSVFLRRAGTVILGINILLWFLATYPKTDRPDAAAPPAATAPPPVGETARSASTQEANPVETIASGAEEEAAGAQLRHSFAGMMGRAIEPLIAPLGFDWKIGIGIVASFAAREVFVSTMSTVYSVSDDAETEAARPALAQTMKAQRRPDGTPLYTPLTGISLMVFYVFALQCVSTVAIMRRETNSWKWPLFQWLYMGVLAWLLAFVTYQGGRLLGWQ